MATNQTDRVLELIKRFNDGQKICINQLIEEAREDAKLGVPNLWINSKGKAVSEKSIRRDLDAIKEHFPQGFELIRGGKGEKGCYKAITKQNFENFMNHEALSLMALTFSMASKSDLFETLELNEDDKKIVAKELKKVNEVYEFKNKPFETSKADNKILKVLKHNIEHHKCVIVEYPVKGKNIKLEVKPYKILFINENFYLACEVEHDEYMFSMYRISKLKTIEETKKTFHTNYELVEFIKDIQTPFATYVPRYKKFLINVVVEIVREKAFFFKQKKHLKSQEILEEKDDGTLVISFQVTQEMEMEELIKKWIPHMKVITPISIKKKIEDDLKRYLTTFR